MFCPEMCRFACPVAVASANDALTPSNKVALLYKHGRWPVRSRTDGEKWPLYACTGCGRCTEYCLYKVQVADLLFEARKQHPWSRAVGLGGDDIYAKKCALECEQKLLEGPPKSLIRKLQGRRWLLHESVWLSRRLGRRATVDDFVARLMASGIELVVPAAHGIDTIDCGGESPTYARLFPSDALRMARMIWERDMKRADGVLCFSTGCREHLLRALDGVPVVYAGGEEEAVLNASGGTASTLVLYNPLSGSGDGGWKLRHKEIKAALAAEYDLKPVSGTERASMLIRSALRDGTRRIIVCGGDGTVSDAAQGFVDISGEGVRLVKSDAVLGVLPIGRGNDFFRSLTEGSMLPGRSAWERGLELLKNGVVKPVDAGLITMSASGRNNKKSVFINITSLGYGGLVVDRVLGKKGWIARTPLGCGGTAYIAQTLVSLAAYKPVGMAISVDGRELYSGPVFSAFVLNGWYNAGGARWSRSARLDDGLFDVLLFEPRGVMETLLTMPRMKSGEWNGVLRAHGARGGRVEVKLLPGARERLRHPMLEADGDLPEPPDADTAVFEILSGAIRVIR